MSIDLSTVQRMLSDSKQVWVRHRQKSRGRAPHWARARLLELRENVAVIKPIKHGGRIEKVPIETIKLWTSMNEKRSNFHDSR